MSLEPITVDLANVGYQEEGGLPAMSAPGEALTVTTRCDRLVAFWRRGSPLRTMTPSLAAQMPAPELLAVSTFSGVGGLDLGLERAGIHSIIQAEQDDWCQAVLRHRFPGAVQLGDVRDVTPELVDDALTRYLGGLDEQGVSEGDEGSGNGGVGEGGALAARRDHQHSDDRGSGPAGRDAGSGGAAVPGSGGAPASAGAHEEHRALQRGPLEHRPGSAGGRRGVDLLHGGFPCQDVSVAGRRAGLAGDRTGLFFEFARIADALRPAWLLLENVPGLLTSNGGRDFGVVLDTLAELGYGVAWRVLDSRYFGVPQRRRRVFIVGRLGGDGASALRALCESCSGSAAAGPCSWQAPAVRARAGAQANGFTGGASERGVAAPLGSLAGGGHRTTDIDAQTFVASTFDWQKGTTGSDHARPDTLNLTEEATGALSGSRVPALLQAPAVSATLQGKRGRGGGGIGPEETFIVEEGLEQDVAPTLREHPRPGSNSDGAIAFNITPQGHRDGDGWGGFADADLSVSEIDEARTLDTRGASSAYVLQPDDAGYAPGAIRGRRVDSSPALGTNTAITDRGLRVIGELEHEPGDVARPFYVKGNGEGYQTDVPNALATGGGQPGQGYAAARTASGVRRLTPVECERLQGFPDNWTLIASLKCPDSRRYAAMGNAVTTNVAEWIARRIVAEHAASLVDSPA